MSKINYLAIIPDDIAGLDADESYLRLPHPRTGQPQLYLPSKESGRVYEVVRVRGTKRRTWFIGDDTIDSGTILVHAPIDPLFLLIPLILPLLPSITTESSGSGSSGSTSSTPFQPLSSLLSTAASSPAHALYPPFTTSQPSHSGKNAPKSPRGEYNEDVGRLLALKHVRRVFKMCCEKKVVPNGPPSPESLNGESSKRSTSTTYYRPSLDKILQLLRCKVEWFATEERWSQFDHNLRQLGREGLLAAGVDADLIKSARLKSSIDHLAQYLPPLLPTLVSKSYDLAPLEVHLANITAAALAASMPSTNLPNKGGKAAAAAAAAAAGKRKAGSSRGVEKLKKVNVASMSKLTSFFKPKDK